MNALKIIFVLAEHYPKQTLIFQQNIPKKKNVPLYQTDQNHDKALSFQSFKGQRPTNKELQQVRRRQGLEL